MTAALAAWLWLAAVARGGEVEVVPVRGALEPGLRSEVQVAVREDDGSVPAEAPVVRVRGETWTLLGPGGSPGVWRYLAHGLEGVDEVRAAVAWPGGSADALVPVRAPSPARLEVRPTARPARAAAVVVTVAGADLPPAEDLQVVVSEGRVAEVRRVAERVEIRVEVEDRPYARWLVVGVRDARADALPAWGLARLVAAVDVPVDTAPGSTVEIEVAGRRYGPVKVGPTGRATLSLEHGPDETTARIRVVDPAGNEATRPFSLTGETSARLLPFVVAPRYPGEGPPEVLVHASRPDGRAWGREAPVCRLPGREPLPLVRVEPGTWRVELPADLPPDAWDVRLRCELGGEVEAGFAVPLAEGVPVGLAVRVWPELLSTDFPVADVSAFLVNAAGERIATDGAWSATGGLGFVTLDAENGPAAHGEYEADLAADVGEDELSVAWRAAPGRGRIDRVIVGGGGDDDAPEVVVRALDATRRPLAERTLRLRRDGVWSVARTDAHGWAVFAAPAVDAGRVVAVEVDAEGRTWRGVVRPGLDGGAGPGRPDLAVVRPVQVDPGRVAEVELEIDPPLVRPRAEATVRVRLLDRSGKLTSSAPPSLSASEGTLLPHGADEAGTWRWTWLPPAGFRRHDVRIVARSEDADVSATAVVVVKPAPVERWIGLSGGVVTNFGTVLSPTATLDAAWRIRTSALDAELPPGRPRLFVRAGAGWFAATYRREVLDGVTGSVRMDLIPIRVGLDLRMEYPAFAWWVGVAGEVVPYVGAASYGGAVVTRRVEILPPGLVLDAGVGVRVPGGEITFELAGAYLRSPADRSRANDVSIPGYLDGLAGRFGWRVFY